MTTPPNDPFSPPPAGSVSASAAPFDPAAPPAARGPVPPPTNGSAIAAFVLSLFAVIPLVSVVAVIVGHFAQATVRRTGEGGYGLARAGTIIGYVGVGLWSLAVVFAVARIAGGLATA